MKNKTNTSFVCKIEANAVEKRIATQAHYINSALATLRRYKQDDTLESLKTCVDRGVDWQIRDAVKECQAYIRDTKMPSYLQDNALRQARESVDAEFIEDMERAVSLVKLPTDLSVLEWDEESRSYRFSEQYVLGEVEKKRYHLSDAEQRDFEKFKAALTLLAEVENEETRLLPFRIITDFNPRHTDADEKLATQLLAYKKPTKDSPQGRVIVIGDC